MAARRTAAYRRRVNVANEQDYRCRDCARSYDWHSRALDGHLILCRCPLKQEGGRFCVFLSDRACKDFIKREEKE